MDEQSVKIEASNKEAENAYRVKKKTFDLLPESEDNLNKLMVSKIVLLSHCSVFIKNLGNG